MDEIRKELMDLLTPVKDVVSHADLLIAKIEVVMQKLEAMELLAAQRHNEIMSKLNQMTEANNDHNDLLEIELKGLIQ